MTDQAITTQDTPTQEEAEVVSTKAKFNFREPSKEAKAKDPTLVKRPTVELDLPYLTTTGLFTALSSGDEKTIEWVLSIVNDRIYDAAKEQVNHDTNPVNEQSQLDEAKLTLEFLANETTERKTSGISKEDWKAFEADYIAVMPALVNKEPAKIEKAAKILVGRYQAVKTSKKVIETLRPMVATWYDSHDEAGKERWAPIAEFLDKKAAELLSVTDESLLKDLI